MPEANREWKPLSRLAEKPIVVLAAYYLILLAVTMLVNRWYPLFPGLPHAGPADGGVGQILTQDFPPTGAQPSGAGEAFLGMVAALLLMSPVAWVYMLTRRQRGYLQSLMHTLVILPIVVAGVVILVKTSIALAFSLGGIVGAIAFRNRLQDTKDAVHVFVAIGVGLACGVQGFGIAMVLSAFYNAINIVLWMGDIGRTPPGLAAPEAAARIGVLRGSEQGSEGVVAQIDTLLLKSMSPEQLDVLVRRADKRRRNMAAEIADSSPGDKNKRWVRIRVKAPPKLLEERRPRVEPVLGRHMKEWRFEGSTSEDDGSVAVYHGRTKKKVLPDTIVQDMKAALGEGIEAVEVQEVPAP
jgi:hypothetical protein